MRTTNNLTSILSCIIFLFGLSLAFELNDGLNMPGTSLEIQNRILQQTFTCSSSCNEYGGSFTDQGLDFNIRLYSDSEITIYFIVGQSARELLLTLETTPVSKIETEVLIAIPLQNTAGLASIEGSSWQKRVSLESSTYSSRVMRIHFENEGRTTTLRFQVSVASPEETDDRPWLKAVIGVIVPLIVIFAICCIIRRIRRNRLLRRRMRSQAAYELERARANQELNAPVVYQPIYHQIQQPPQNYQQVPQAIVHVPPPNNLADPNLPLAPPMELVIGDPNSGPLTEQNIDHRFPEAPFENFNSSFPQKTCSVCLEDLNKTQTCRQLYCEHIFHAECAKVWLLNQMKKQNHGYCPNCNKNMTFVLERAKPH